MRTGLVAVVMGWVLASGTAWAVDQGSGGLTAQETQCAAVRDSLEAFIRRAIDSSEVEGLARCELAQANAEIGCTQAHPGQCKPKQTAMNDCTRCFAAARSAGALCRPLVTVRKSDSHKRRVAESYGRFCDLMPAAGCALYAREQTKCGAARALTAEPATDATGPVTDALPF